MVNIVNKRIALLLSATVLSFFCLAILHAQSENGVKIAINVPLTSPIAAWSGQFANGFLLGMEDECRKKNIDPKVFSVDVQDNGGKPAQAVTIFKKQEMNGSDVYVTVTTGAVNAIAGQLDALGKPQFIAAFDPFITRQAPARLRVMANSKIEAPLLVKYAKDRKARKVFIVQINMSYAEDEFGKIVQPQLEKAGIKVVRERYNLEDRDFKTIALKVKAEAPDLILLCGYSFHLQPMLHDLRSYGLIQKDRIVSVMDYVDLVESGMPVKELQDVVFVCPLFDVPGKIAQASDWRHRYEQRFKLKPTYVPAYAYDNATLIVDAYAKSGKVDMSSLMMAMPFDGISGTIKVDSDHDIVSTITLAEIDKNGHIVEVR